MLRYKTETRPGLVALYDIRPGNGVGQFFTTPEPARGESTEVSTQPQVKAINELRKTIKV